MADYTRLPLPDYDRNQGLRGHRPDTKEEHAQGFVVRTWNKRNRLRCCFCPLDMAMDEGGMRLHVLQQHWLKHFPGEDPNQPATRPAEARLYDGAGKLVKEVQVTKPVPPPARAGSATLNAPIPRGNGPVENFLDNSMEDLLNASVDSFVKDGIINAPNED